MIQYNNVHSTIFPVIQRSKTKVRVPSNLREQEIIDDNGESRIEYIYDEVVYDINEYFMIENQNLNEALNVSMVALDMSYKENSTNTDTILVAVDEAFIQIAALQEQINTMNGIIEGLQAEINAMKGEAE